MAEKRRYKTGFCSNGHCEGTKPVNYRGRPMPICTLWEKCGCECHERITKMYADIGVPRIEAQQNPDYKPDPNPFVLPDLRDRHAPPVTLNGPRLIVSELDEATATPPPQPGTTVVEGRAFAPTPTGYRGRGQLEYEVLEVVRVWVSDPAEDEEICTPKLVAERILALRGGMTPSTGAIQAVWDRWEKLGIATQAKKPARFTGWVGDFDGTADALDRIKAAKKRQAKAAKAEAGRRIRT